LTGSSVSNGASDLATLAFRTDIPQLPDYEYPVPVDVQNTFINHQPPQLDGLVFKESVASPAHIGAPPGLELRGDKEATDAGGFLPPGLETSVEEPQVLRLAPALAKPTKVVLLADVLVEPELGSAEYPTVGSGRHRLGSCKPCAFLHTKGCQNGTQCPFCHICEPGAKKRRQKERKEQRRELNRWETLVTEGRGTMATSPIAPPRAPGAPLPPPR